jgi:hypothetical protein
MPLPQPFVVKMEAAAAATGAPHANWSDVAAYLRDTAKWILGGVVGTAGAVIAGTSLSNIGSLDPVDDLGRLSVTAAGAVVGFAAIGFLFSKALDVFDVPAVDLPTVADARKGSEWTSLLNEINRQFPQLSAKDGKSLKALIEDRSDEALVERIAAMLSYLHVRSRFRTMTFWLFVLTPVAAIGFSVFAWGANPPERSSPPAPPPVASFY